MFKKYLPKIVTTGNNSKHTLGRTTNYATLYSRERNGEREKIGSVQWLEPEHGSLWKRWKASRSDSPFADSPSLELDFFDIQVGTEIEDGWLQMHTPTPELVRFVAKMHVFSGIFLALSGISLIAYQGHISYTTTTMVRAQLSLFALFFMLLPFYNFCITAEYYITYHGRRKAHEYPDWLKKVYRKHFVKRNFQGKVLEYMPHTIEYSLMVHNSSVWWRWGSKLYESSSDDPWYRSFSFSPKEWLLGDYVVTKQPKVDVDYFVDFDKDEVYPKNSNAVGEHYRVNVQLYEQHFRRKRLPKRFTKTVQRSTVSTLNKSGVPIPGKGTCSYNQTDDAIQSHTGNYTTVEDAVQGFKDSILDYRERYPL